MINALRGSIAAFGILAGDGGCGFGQYVAAAVDDLRDQVRRDAIAAVGEHRVRLDHLQRRRGAGAQRHRQVGRVQLGVEAETRDVVLRILRADRLQHAHRDEILRRASAVRTRIGPSNLPS